MVRQAVTMLLRMAAMRLQTDTAKMVVALLRMVTIWETAAFP